MKKVVISFIVLILIITALVMVLEKNSKESASINTEEKIEKALIKSMEESKNDKKKIEELLTITSQGLNDKGYTEIGLSYSHEDRILTVQVKDNKFVETNKEKIENIISNIAKEIKFQDFEVNFMTLDSYVTLSKEDEKIKEVADVISDLLEETGYHYYSISTHPNKEIIIELQESKEDLEKSHEVEKRIANTIFSKTNMNFVVKLQKKSKSEIRDQAWQPIFDAIREETNKKFEEYRGFAYSFHPEPLEIIIKTDIDTPNWFWNSDKKVNEITEYVKKIIQLKREELSIKEIPYEIIIRDKNDKKIN